MTAKLCLAQDPEADALLESSPFALLTGMLLDQQVNIRLQPWKVKRCALSSVPVSR